MKYSTKCHISGSFLVFWVTLVFLRKILVFCLRFFLTRLNQPWPGRIFTCPSKLIPNSQCLEQRFMYLLAPVLYWNVFFWMSLDSEWTRWKSQILNHTRVTKSRIQLIIEGIRFYVTTLPELLTELPLAQKRSEDKALWILPPIHNDSKSQMKTPSKATESRWYACGRESAQTHTQLYTLSSATVASDYVYDSFLK